MGSQARAGDYNFERRPTTLDRSAAASPRTPAVKVPPRSGDAAAVDDFLQKLARAVQQFRTYPATSPLCHTAVDAAHRALSQLAHRDQIAFRVAPQELIVDDVGCGRGGIVEHELARRLHLASIAEVTIDHGASEREVSRFCLDLVHCDDRTKGRTTFMELLTEHGVDRIAVRPAYRPEVLDVGAAPSPVARLIAQQQQRRDELFASGGAINHLYAPDKGWVRLDPAAPFTTVSLVDLALLAEDPTALAAMLLRLTDGEAPEGATGEDALAQKFSDVATLFNALDPRVGRVMFSKLARAVLDLHPDRRQALLRRTILPGLLDGRTEGGVLRDFPDLDLADSLCLLLDLETAAPEVVTTALARLDLPAERHAAVVPLLEDRLQQRTGVAPRDTSVDAHARRLLNVETGRARSFAELSAFDLALDEHTSEILQQIRDGIAGSDAIGEQLECLSQLMRLEPNPEVAQRFFDRSTPFLDRLEREGHWTSVAAWLTRYRELSAALADTRPDVAEAIARKLTALCTPERASRVAAVAEQSADGRACAGMMLRALGAAMAPALLAIVQNRIKGHDAIRKAAVALLCDNASLAAPALAAALGGTDQESNRTIIRVLGFAGSGYEAALGPHLASADEQTVREALRSLAKIGTSQAAALVCSEIEKHRGWVAAAAEETLWRFPSAEAHRQIVALLGRREFVVKHPDLAARLLDRAAQAGASGLEPVLASLVSLRFRLWKPALVRLARKAHALGKR